MQKRILSLVLAACLLLSLTSAALAGENRNFYMQQNDIIANQCEHAVAVGDTIYAAVYDRSDGLQYTIQRWRAGMDAPEPVITEGIQMWQNDEDTGLDTPLVVSSLFTDGARVYGYDSNRGTVSLLVDENGEPAPKKLFSIDISAFSYEDEGYFDTGSIMSQFAQDGVMHILVSTWTPAERTLYLRYSMETGELIETPENENVTHFTSIAPYKDGQLLAFMNRDGETWNDETGEEIPSVLCTFDPATATLTELGTTVGSGDTGLVYQPLTDSIYFVENSTVYRFSPDGQHAVAAYLPFQYWGGNSGQSFMLMPDNTFVAASYEGLILRELDRTDIQNGALAIGFNDDAHSAVVAQNPALPVSVTYADTSLQALANAFTSGEELLDIYSFSYSHTPLDRIIKKGYAADISLIPGVKEYMAMVDARFAAPLLGENGEIYGVPMNIEMSVMGYRPEVLEELGLTVGDLPTTWMEMLDFIANWEYDYADDYPDINLFDNLGYKGFLFQFILSDYVAYQLKTEGSITFDTPLLRKLLETLAQIDFTEIDPYEKYGDNIWDDDDAMNEFWSKDGLFSTFASARAFDMNDSYSMPILLALDTGIDPVLSANMNVLMVSSRTTRMELVSQYLGAYLQNIPERMQADMFPSFDRQVENPYYESSMKSYQDEIDRYTALLEAAAEENKAELRETIENYTLWMAEYEEQRYVLSAQTLENYQTNFFPYIFVTPQTPLTDYSSDSSDELRTLQNQYLQGATTLDQYLKETDQRIRMMMLEDQ